jgi:hypothetical protein
MSDISAISGLQQSQLLQQVSYKVAGKAQDVAKFQGQAAISLLQQAAEFAKAVEPGKGARIDVTA